MDEHRIDQGISITLKEYLETQFGFIEREILEHDKLYDTRFRAAELAVTAALAAQEKLFDAVNAAAKEAILKAEAAQKDYNVRSNEFRAQLDDQAKLMSATMMTRNEVNGLLQAVDEKLNSSRAYLESRMEVATAANTKSIDRLTMEVAGLRESRSEGSGKSMGSANLWGYIVGGVGLIAVIIEIVSRLPR